MGNEGGVIHQIKSFRIPLGTLGQFVQAEAVEPRTGGVAPVEHRLGEAFHRGELAEHMATTTEVPELAEQLRGLGTSEAILRSPVGEVVGGRFLADREDAGENDENLVGIQSRCEATELDATSRAKLREVDHSVLADVD